MKESHEHLVSILQYPETAAASQQAYDRERFAFVERCARSRPHFLPVTHTLPAAAQTMPISETTEQLNHDVILHGAITDGESRNIKFYKDIEARPLVRYGREANTRLSLDAIAGHSVATAGFPGVTQWPEPMLLRADQFLTVEMFQETSPGSTELVWTVFTGSRVYTSRHAEAELSQGVQDAVWRHIRMRPAPETRYAVCQVDFDLAGAGGVANAETPKTEEPLLVVGFRSTFTDALVNLGFDGDTSFAKSKFPIWALANEPNNGEKLFQALRTPLFIPPNQQLMFSLENSIDDVLFATDGNIEVLMRTV